MQKIKVPHAIFLHAVVKSPQRNDCELVIIGVKIVKCHMWGFIFVLQLVERHTSTAEVMGLNAVEALNFPISGNSSFQLLKLENLLRQSLFTLVHILLQLGTFHTHQTTRNKKTSC